MDEKDRRNERESGRRGPPPASAYPAAPRLLDALRERLRYMHYSLRTEETYVYWVRGFVRWTGGKKGGEKGAAGAGPGSETSLIANLLYGTGMRLLEGDRLRDDRGPGIAAREPFIPCYRATPSSTARATSAS